VASTLDSNLSLKILFLHLVSSKNIEIKSFHIQAHAQAEFKPTILCSGGGGNSHCATPPGAPLNIFTMKLCEMAGTCDYKIYTVVPRYTYMYIYIYVHIHL
jgi:hypothetical protein